MLLWYLLLVLQIPPQLQLQQMAYSSYLKLSLLSPSSKSGVTLLSEYVSFSWASYYLTYFLNSFWTTWHNWPGTPLGRVYYPTERSTSRLIISLQELPTVCVLFLWFQWHTKTCLLLGDYYYVRAGNELISMGLTSCDTMSNETQANGAHQAGKTRQHLSLLLSAAVVLLLTTVYVA